MIYDVIREAVSQCSNFIIDVKLTDRGSQLDDFEFVINVDKDTPQFKICVPWRALAAGQYKAVYKYTMRVTKGSIYRAKQRKLNNAKERL